MTDQAPARTPLAVGDALPDVALTRLGSDGPEEVRSVDVLGRGKVVVFAVPGAFTPTCSDYHLPGFVVRAPELREAGVDTIACVSVNDAWVMAAWGEAQGVGEDVLMLADGNAELAHATGLVMDARARGLGVRSQRYAAVVDDGIVTALLVEDAPGLNRSSADAVLAVVRAATDDAP